jgi:hypothetical protein
MINWGLSGQMTTTFGERFMGLSVQTGGLRVKRHWSWGGLALRWSNHTSDGWQGINCECCVQTATSMVLAGETDDVTRWRGPYSFGRYSMFPPLTLNAYKLQPLWFWWESHKMAAPLCGNK